MEILILLFAAVVLEYFFSLLKKDEVYSFGSFSVNILTQFFGIVKDITLPVLSVMGIIAVADKYIPHIYTIPSTATTLLLCVLLMDFLYYVFHRANHHFLVLWMFHFVHHSDKKYNLSVGFRSSWFEMVGLFTTYSLLLLIGFPLLLFITAFSVTSTYQFLTHGRYIKMPRWFDYVFVTQQYHLVHHGEELENQNSNFGGVFSFWDRLFSTYSNKEDVTIFGIEGYSQNNVIKVQTDPLLRYGKLLFKKMKV